MPLNHGNHAFSNSSADCERELCPYDMKHMDIIQTIRLQVGLNSAYPFENEPWSPLRTLAYVQLSVYFFLGMMKRALKRNQKTHRELCCS